MPRTILLSVLFLTGCVLCGCQTVTPAANSGTTTATTANPAAPTAALPPLAGATPIATRPAEWQAIVRVRVALFG